MVGFTHSLYHIGMALWDRFRTPRMAAVFHDDYVTGYDPMGPDGIIDPLRPSRIRAALLKDAHKRLVHWVTPPLATTTELELIHPPAYLEDASKPAFIAEVLGLPAFLPWETEMWDGIRRATGGTVEAVRVALEKRVPVFNLGGGFHHAHPQRATGFCIINDIAVAVAAARARGFTGKIAIVDLDYHHGDGTEACLANDPHTWTLSVHPTSWADHEKTESIRHEIPVDLADAAYLAEVHTALAQLDQKIAPELVLYVAGTDPWENDRLCNMRITAGGMLERDLTVSRWARARNAPLVVVPAGGYGPETWRITAAFASAVLKGGSQ